MVTACNDVQKTTGYLTECDIKIVALYKYGYALPGVLASC